MIAELCVVLGQLFCAWDSDKRSEYQDMCKPSVLSALEWDKFECAIPQCRLDTMLCMPQLAQVRQVSKTNNATITSISGHPLYSIY